MFKAMAATTAHDGEDEPDESLVEETLVEADAELGLATAPVGSADDLDVEDDDDEDEDDDLDPLDDHALDEDDDDLDADDVDDDEDDEDDEDDDTDEADDFDDDEDDDDDDDDDGVVASAPLAAPGRSRRRAAARPAGPPVSEI
jgi:ribonuclease E